MTLIKAITARALADELQSVVDVPVAPVFWAATDDADFDEAAVVSVALAGGARELSLERRAPAGTPMSRVAIDADIDALAAQVRDASGSAPHASYLDIGLTSFRSGATIGDAYVDVLRKILEPLEIAVLDASHQCVARAGTPLLGRAAEGAEELAAAIRRRTEAIIAAGYEPQVEQVSGLSLVFLNLDGTKRRLSFAEAASLDTLHATRFLSPTVLLRPVLERALLPTAAYVGGPGEVAYFAQVTAVADALDVSVPLVVPRWSATIIEPRVQRILDEFGIAADAFADPHAVEQRVARERLPSQAEQSLERLRGDVAGDVERLRAASDGLVSDTVLDGLRRAVEHRVARVERRYTAAVKRRETEVMHRLATARGSLYPYGARQERKLAFIPFLARYGPGLVEQMLAAARAHARLLVHTAAPALARDVVPAVR